MVGKYDVVRARGLDRGDGLTLARQSWVRVPPGFEATRLSLRPGVEAVYREDRPTGPLRIRRFADRVTIRRERYHPGYHPVKHFVYDLVPDGVMAGVHRPATLAGSLATLAGRTVTVARRVARGLGRVGAALGHVV